MNNSSKNLTFPDDRLLGYLHLKYGDGPMEFHGRFKKDDDLLERTRNPGWRLLGEARSSVAVPKDSITLLEVLS